MADTNSAVITKLTVRSKKPDNAAKCKQLKAMQSRVSTDDPKSRLSKSLKRYKCSGHHGQLSRLLKAAAARKEAAAVAVVTASPGPAEFAEYARTAADMLKARREF